MGKGEFPSDTLKFENRSTSFAQFIDSGRVKPQKEKPLTSKIPANSEILRCLLFDRETSLRSHEEFSTR